MNRITSIIDIIALQVQIIATIIMLIYSPKNQPKGAFMYPEVDLKTPHKRERNIRLGFIVLCFGFVLQLVSLMIKLLE